MRCRPRQRSRCVDASRWAPPTRCARTGDGWEATNTDVDGFLAPLEAAFGTRRCDGVARVGARRRRCGARRRRRAASRGRARHGARAAARAGAASSRAISARRRARGRRRRDRGICWSTARRLAAPARATSRRCRAGRSTGRLVYDLTYGAGESPLLRDARAAGCATLDGLPMLVAQAERQFEWWTGQQPAPGVMAGGGSCERTLWRDGNA